MILRYVPLLATLRRVYDVPRGPERFTAYVRATLMADRTDVGLVPLVAANPMAREHVPALLDDLLTLDADGLAARVTAEAADQLGDEPGEYRVALTVADDLKGGWTNRVACEFDLRVGCAPQSKRFWGPIGVLWSSEPASERAVREAVRSAVYRTAFTARHGPPRTLRDVLTQEGEVMARAGCAGPELDPEDLEYTREVLTPYLDATDKRTIMQCLFGDGPCSSLGFPPFGLSPWAGLALARRDAQAAVTTPLPRVG